MIILYFTVLLASLKQFRYTYDMDFQIHHVKSVDSTNTVLKEKAINGFPEGFVLVSDSQTNGRGRLSRSFFSPPGSGLYMSLLLRPACFVPPASLTCLAAVAAADAIFSLGKECSVKWVNDIYCGNKKAGGILVESGMKSNCTYDYVVVGIGINLFPFTNIPDDLRSIATNVFDGTPDPEIRDSFLISLLNSFSVYYEKLPEITFRERYLSLLNCIGKEVYYQNNGMHSKGIAESVDDAFRLIVKDGNNRISLDRGEVSFVPCT